MKQSNPAHGSSSVSYTHLENGCATYLKNEEELLNDITKTLAGKAGVSLIYGVMDAVSYTHLDVYKRQV